MQGMLHCVADAMAVPQAYEAGLRVHVGMPHRFVEVEFHGYCGKVYRVLDTDVVRSDERTSTMVSGRRYRRAEKGDEERGIPRSSVVKATGIALNKGEEKGPFRSEPAFHGCQHADPVSRWWR